MQVSEVFSVGHCWGGGHGYGGHGYGGGYGGHGYGGHHWGGGHYGGRGYGHYDGRGYRSGSLISIRIGGGRGRYY